MMVENVTVASEPKWDVVVDRLLVVAIAKKVHKER